MAEDLGLSGEAQLPLEAGLEEGQASFLGCPAIGWMISEDQATPMLQVQVGEDRPLIPTAEDAVYLEAGTVNIRLDLSLGGMAHHEQGQAASAQLLQHLHRLRVGRAPENRDDGAVPVEGKERRSVRGHVLGGQSLAHGLLD